MAEVCYHVPCRLLSTFGGENSPCCGFGFGDAVIVELLKDCGKLPTFKHEASCSCCVSVRGACTPHGTTKRGDSVSGEAGWSCRNLGAPCSLLDFLFLFSVMC
jgi:hypothetical protein